MSELRDAIADALRATVRREVGDTVYIDEMSESMAEVYTGRIMALIEQSRPSREEFERALDAYCEAQRTLDARIAWAGFAQHTDDPKGGREKKERSVVEAVDQKRATLNEVMRMAGFPEER